MRDNKIAHHLLAEVLPEYKQGMVPSGQLSPLYVLGMMYFLSFQKTPARSKKTPILHIRAISASTGSVSPSPEGYGYTCSGQLCDNLVECDGIIQLAKSWGKKS